MEIRSGAGYPAGELSNFARHPFRFRGMHVNSMEGLLQGLKYRCSEEQAHIFTMVGADAKKTGARSSWDVDRTLYWQETPIDRHAPEYQSLLDEAYRAMFDQNQRARAALLSTGDTVLTHTIGRSEAQKTILTRDEFCSRLMAIRNELRTRAT